MRISIIFLIVWISLEIVFDVSIKINDIVTTFMSFL